MKIRLSAKLMADLRRATIHYRMPDYATVCEKALYSAWRNNPNLKKIKLESTYGGEALRVDIAEIRWLQNGHMVRPKRRAEFLRRALTWYLAKQEYRPIEAEAIIQDQAYIVENEEEE